MLVRILTAASLTLLTANSLCAASFDCAKARTRVEKMICADARLAGLDELLGRFYSGALVVLQRSPCLRDEQRAWLTEVRNRCTDVACLQDAYMLRLSALSALQPGASLPKDMEFPPTPRLRWIIPASSEPDPLALLDSKPGEVDGIVSYEEGGYVVSATDGRLHILAPDVYIGDESRIQLDVLAEARTPITASGRHAVTSGGDPAFDNRHCIVIRERV